MSEPDPYRSLYPDQPHIQKLYKTVGEPVSQTGRQNSAGANVEQATFSTAPYRGRGAKCMANKDTCDGNRAKGSEYCIGHLRSFGLLKNDKSAAFLPKEPT
jgi:hypothetical protein